MNLGRAEENFGTFNLSSFRARGVELLAIGSIPITQQFSLYGKAGGIYSRVNTRILGATARDNTVDFTFGLGARFNFTRNFAARAEWQRYQNVGDDSTFGTSNIDLFSLGLLYGFY